MRKIEDVCPVSEEKITDIAEALTLAASLKEGTLAELKELIAQQMIDKMVEWRWIRLRKGGWRITAAGIRRSAFYREPTLEEAELGRSYHQL